MVCFEVYFSNFFAGTEGEACLPKESKQNHFTRAREEEWAYGRLLQAGCHTGRKPGESRIIGSARLDLEPLSSPLITGSTKESKYKMLGPGQISLPILALYLLFSLGICPAKQIR